MSQSGVYETNVSPGSQPVLFVEGNDSVEVPPNPATGVINIIGASGISTSGDAGTYTLTITGSSTGSTIHGDSGSIAGPDVTIYTNQASLGSGSTAYFDNSGTVSTLHLSDANRNIILGSAAGNLTISGSLNSGIGYQVLSTLTTGQYNCALGESSLDSIRTGSYNIGIGAGVGAGLSGNENSNIYLNSGGVGGDNNILRIGFATGTDPEELQAAYICGIDGVNLNTANVVVEVADQLGTAVLTAGTGIAITPGTNTITISSTGAGAFWNFVSTDQTMVPNNGYVCISPGGDLNMTLPSTAAQGTELEVILSGATSFTIVQADGQQIQYGDIQTTLGSGGSLVSTKQGDTIRLICQVADTFWVAASTIGNLTVN